MAELAALNIKITGDASDLQAAVAAAKGDLLKLIAGADAAGLKIGKINTKFGAGAKSSDGFANSMRGVSQQLSQVGQQTMATGNFVQALAIQLPDIGVAFGAVGAAAGLLAGIALPLLINAFGGTSEKAAALAGAIKELTDATAAFRLQAAAITLSIDQEEVLLVQELNALLAQRASLEEQIAKGAVNARDTSRLQLATINETIAPLQKQLDAYRAARAELARVKAETDKVHGVTNEVVTAIDDAAKAMGVLVASAPQGGWLAGAIGDAQRLATALWDSAAAQAANRPSDSKLAGAYGLYGFTREQGPDSKAAQDAAAAAKGGGGGSATNPIQSELDAVQNSLMTQEQLQLESFARQQETLQTALAQRLITQQEYAAMMEAAQQQHSDAMAGIDVYRYGTGLQQAGAFLGGLADVFASGNDRLLRISRIAGAAQGMIDAWGAYLKALNAPGGLTPMGRLAAALPVLAAGLKAVSAIKGGGSGGGGSGVATAAAGAMTSASSSPLQVMLNTYGAGDMIRGADLGALLDRLGQEAGDRGYRLMWAPS